VKAALVGVGTALAASACCIGTVAFSVIGAGAWARPQSDSSRIARGSSG
jgi:hypothetical protein